MNSTMTTPSNPSKADERLKARGIDRDNTDFARYEGVHKPHAYRLSEAEANSGVESFNEDFQIREVDMAPYFHGGDAGRAQFARELGAALEDIGFAILVGHGIELEHYERMHAATRNFFEQTPESTRTPFIARRHGSVNQGYFPVHETTRIHPDLVEGWVFCRRAFDLDGDADFDARRFWPDPAREIAFRAHAQRHLELVQPIMRSILRYFDCPAEAFDEKLQAPNFGLRLNYYPALDEGQQGRGGRMLGHEDVDLFTLLPAPAVEGLQVLERRSMQWVRLSAPPGSLIINTGDYMQRITNDRLPSTTHRVARPRTPTAEPRVSLPMAIYLWENELLEVLPGLEPVRYPPIKALRFHTQITSKYYGDDYAVR